MLTGKIKCDNIKIEEYLPIEQLDIDVNLDRENHNKKPLKPRKPKEETNVNNNNNTNSAINSNNEGKTNQNVKIYDVHGVNDGLQLQVSVANDEITNKLIVSYI